MKKTVIIVFWLMSVNSVSFSAPAQASVDGQFEELVRRGNTMLAEGRLRDAAGQFKAAAGLKTSPSIWLKLVSIYSDISKSSSSGDDECDNSRLTMESFFRSCEQCIDPSNPSCRVCLMVKSTERDHLANRTSNLAESLEQASQAEAQKASRLKGSDAKRAERKSTGFEAKAMDVARCLSRFHVTSAPVGAVIRLNGSRAGTSPVMLTVFAGQHELTAEMVGRPLESKTANIDGSTEQAIHFSFDREEVGAQVPAKVDPPEASSGMSTLIWPIAMFGIGMSAGAIGGYLMIDSSEISSRAVTTSEDGRIMDGAVPPSSITEAQYNQARADHELGTALLSAGTGLLIGGLIWWLWPEDDEKPKGREGKETKLDNPAAVVPYTLLPGEVLP